MEVKRGACGQLMVTETTQNIAREILEAQQMRKMHLSVGVT